MSMRNHPTPIWSWQSETRYKKRTSHGNPNMPRAIKTTTDPTTVWTGYPNSMCLWTEPLKLNWLNDTSANIINNNRVLQENHGHSGFRERTRTRNKSEEMTDEERTVHTGVDGELATQLVSSINLKRQHITAYTFSRSGDSRWDPKISTKKQQQGTKNAFGAQY
jgi:hypothetical protein